MRRIYESSALYRDDDEPHAPTESDSSDRPQAMRSVPGGLLSRIFVPLWLRYHAISVDISTPASSFGLGESIPFRVTMKNAFPIPITLPTESPVLWQWHVDGLPEASRVQVTDPPDERRGFRFQRGERKTFTRRWDQRFRVSESEWEPASPGTYTIGAAINIADAKDSGLTDEVSIRVSE